MSSLNEILVQGFRKCLSQSTVRFSAIKGKQHYRLDNGDGKRPHDRYVDFWVQRNLNRRPRFVRGAFLPGEDIDWSANPPYIIDTTELSEKLSKEQIDEVLKQNPYIVSMSTKYTDEQREAIKEHYLYPLQQSALPNEMADVKMIDWLSDHEVLIRLQYRQ